MTLPYIYLVCYFASLITGCIWPELSPMLHIINIVCLGGFIVSAVIVLGMLAYQARQTPRLRVKSGSGQDSSR